MSEAKTGFTRGFFGCFGVLAAVVVVIAGLASLGNCGNTPAQKTEPVPELTGAALLSQQVGTEVLSPEVADQAVKAAIKESRIRSQLRAEGVKAFYFAGQPTVCGYLADDKARVRFIHRNGNAVVETNHDPEVFKDFWKVCQAGGVN